MKSYTPEKLVSVSRYKRKVIHGLYKLPMVKMENKRRLLKDGQE